MTATLPTLEAFLTVLAESIGGPWETQRPNGTWDNATVFGREREAHYPGMVKLSNGTTFPLTWGTDWCSIRAGWAYHKAGGWPAEWQLPAQMFYTPEDVAAWKAAGRWHDGPNGGQPGDFIFFDWRSDLDRLANHVGVVVDVVPGGYRVNEGNVGSPSVYSRESFYSAGVDILGFGRPEFATITPPTPGEEDMPIIKSRIQPFEGQTILAPGGWLTGELADAVEAGTSGLVVSRFHAQAIASQLALAGVDGRSLKMYPGESLTAPQRAELLALGVTAP
jgi:CHAP domain